MRLGTAVYVWHQTTNTCDRRPLACVSPSRAALSDRLHWLLGSGYRTDVWLYCEGGVLRALGVCYAELN